MLTQKNSKSSVGSKMSNNDLSFEEQKKEDGQQKYEQNYLDIFIECTETFINEPYQAANMCTDLANDISELVFAGKSVWEHHFASDSMLHQRRIEEKIIQFLQNCVFIIENQPELNKIMLNSMSNISNITYPLSNSFGEKCLKTLGLMYKNNVDLRKNIKSSLIRNVFSDFHAYSYQIIEVNILRGLINFMEDIPIADWFTEAHKKNFGGWIKEISQIFLNILKDSDIQLTKEEIQRIDVVLEFVSKNFSDDNFAKVISFYVEIEGILAIIDQCQKYAMTAEDRKQNNRILVFVLDIISKATLFNPKLQADTQQQDSKQKNYETVLFDDLDHTLDDLNNCQFDFRTSEKVKTYQQTQIMNRKLGGLIKAYSQILVHPGGIPIPLKDQRGFKRILTIYTEIKKLDPYIFGSLCHFICVLLKDPTSIGKDTDFRDFVQCFEHFLPLMSALEPKNFLKMLKLGNTYSRQIIVNQENKQSMQNMSIKEVQYAYIGLMKVFHLTRDLLIYTQKQPLSSLIINQLKDIKRIQYQNGFKSQILSCLEAPNEELRLSVAQHLDFIPIDLWEIQDLKSMIQVLTFCKVLLQQEQGEKEIFTIIMIFCKMVQQPKLAITKTLMESQTANDVVNIATSILQIDMMRKTSNDKAQTESKVGLAISCIYLLAESAKYSNLQRLFFSQNSTQVFKDCILAEDHLLNDGPHPLLVEQLSYNVSPLLQNLESSHPIKPTGLVAFRTIMQISAILCRKCYSTLSGTHKIKVPIHEPDSKQVKPRTQTPQVKKPPTPIDQTPPQHTEVKQLTMPDLITQFEGGFFQMAKDQWNSWGHFPEQFDDDMTSDLTSSFEVQHTIFSQQNGIGRILNSLNPIIQNYKNWSLQDFPASIVMTKIKDFFKLIDNDVDGEHMQNILQPTSQTVIFNKHAIHQYLVGCGIFTIDPLIIDIFNDQFFETLQFKTTTANSMVDLNKLSDVSFFNFMKEENKTFNQIAKIALITSAFLYCSYIMIQFAPIAPDSDSQIKFDAINQIEHKTKIRGFIMLCACSDWCNSNVALKLLKIYRIILKHILLTQNIDRSNEYNESIKTKTTTQAYSDAELKRKTAKPSQPTQASQQPVQAQTKQSVIPTKLSALVKDTPNPTFYKSRQSLEDRIESASYIMQMIQKVLSDFKEIIECLDYEQLIQQLKLLNGIFKTLHLIYKFYLIIVEILCKELKLKPQQFNTSIFKMLSFINLQLQPENLIVELTTCVEKISQCKFKNRLNKLPLLEKLYRNIAIALGQIFTLKRYMIKDIFSLVCQKFEAGMSSNILDWANKIWLADLTGIKLFSEVHPQAPFFSLKIPLMSTEVSLHRLDAFTSEQHDEVIMLIYFDGVLFLQIKDLIKDLYWLYNKFSLENIKIIHQLTYKTLKSAQIVIDDSDDDLKFVLTKQEPKSVIMKIRFSIQEHVKSFFGATQKDVEKDVNYNITFQNPYICNQVSKILNSILGNKHGYYKFD